MNRRSLVVAALLFLLGVLLLGGWLPGLGGTSLALRYAMGASLVTLSLLMLAIPATVWLIRMTTRPEDYEGTCPVGKVCPDCGTFNFNPRQSCRSCQRDLRDVGPATRESS